MKCKNLQYHKQKTLTMVRVS